MERLKKYFPLKSKRRNKATRRIYLTSHNNTCQGLPDKILTIVNKYIVFCWRELLCEVWNFFLPFPNCRVCKILQLFQQPWKCSPNPRSSYIRVALSAERCLWLFLIVSSFLQPSSTEKALANQFLAPGRTPTTIKERTPATKTVHLQTKARCTGKMRSELLGTVCFGAAASLLLARRWSLMTFGCLWWLCLCYVPGWGWSHLFSFAMDNLNTGHRCHYCAWRTLVLWFYMIVPHEPFHWPCVIFCFVSLPDSQDPLAISGKFNLIFCNCNWLSFTGKERGRPGVRGWPEQLLNYWLTSCQDTRFKKTNTE